MYWNLKGGGSPEYPDRNLSPPEIERLRDFFDCLLDPHFWDEECSYFPGGRGTSPRVEPLGRATCLIRKLQSESGSEELRQALCWLEREACKEEYAKEKPRIRNIGQAMCLWAACLVAPFLYSGDRYSTVAQHLDQRNNFRRGPDPKKTVNRVKKLIRPASLDLIFAEQLYTHYKRFRGLKVRCTRLEKELLKKLTEAEMRNLRHRVITESYELHNDDHRVINWYRYSADSSTLIDCGTLRWPFDEVTPISGTTGCVSALVRDDPHIDRWRRFPCAAKFDCREYQGIDSGRYLHEPNYLDLSASAWLYRD